jgi:ubiquinone/menaquinone biosynthesis C-methylase UbiE
MSNHTRTATAVGTLDSAQGRANGDGSAQPPEWSVQRLMETHLGFAPSRILSTALELEVFTHIAQGKSTVAKIAGASGATDRGMQMLLDAIAGIGLLVKRDSRYALTEISERHLVKGKPAYFGQFLSMNPLWDAWGHLTEAVRTGKPYLPIERKDVAEDFFPKLIRSLHVVHSEPARRAAEVLGAGSGTRDLRVLDVAAGSGIWGISIAEACPAAHVTAHDFPAVLEVTREFVARHRLANRFDFLPGDLKGVDFGEARYDIAVLGNIVHSEGERSARGLIRRIHRALVPDGRLVIIEMVPNDERSGPPFPLIFALNMLVNTETGGTFTFAEFTRWLTDAGFRRVEAHDIGSHSPMIVGHKV